MILYEEGIIQFYKNPWATYVASQTESHILKI